MTIKNLYNLDLLMQNPDYMYAIETDENEKTVYYASKDGISWEKIEESDDIVRAIEEFKNNPPEKSDYNRRKRSVLACLRECLRYINDAASIIEDYM